MKKANWILKAPFSLIMQRIEQLIGRKQEEVLYLTCLVSTVAFRGLYFLLKNTVYAYIKTESVPKFVSWFNGTLHVIIIFSAAILFLRNHLSIYTWRITLCASIGFFLSDLTIIPDYSSSLEEALGMLIHHISVIFYLTLGMFLRQTNKVLAQGLLSEITNPILFLGWLLIKMNLQHSIWAKIVAALLLVTYAVCRVFNFSYIYIHRKTLAPELSSKVSMLIFTPMVAMNYYWFIKILWRVLSLV